MTSINPAKIAEFNRAAFCIGLIAEGSGRSLTSSLKPLAQDVVTLSSKPPRFEKPVTAVDVVREWAAEARAKFAKATTIVPPSNEPNSVMKEIESSAITIKPPKGYDPQALTQAAGKVEAVPASIVPPAPKSVRNTSTMLPPASESVPEVSLKPSAAPKIASENDWSDVI